MKRKTVDFEDVRRMALALPGTIEGLSYGTPGFRVRGKLYARLKEDGGTLVVGIDLDEREALVAGDPETFFITDHYRGYPWILVRLSQVHPADLRWLLESAWSRWASKRLAVARKSKPGADAARPARRRRQSRSGTSKRTVHGGAGRR